MLIYLIHRKMRCRWLDFFFRRATYMGSLEFSICVMSILIYIGRKLEINHGIYILISMSTAQLIAQSIKMIFNRARPNTKGRSSNPFNIPLYNYSFPSGHTTAAFSLATALSYCFSGAIIFYSCAIIVAVSRVYLGVHYPTDVIAGMSIGSVSSGMVHHYYENIINWIEVII